MDPTKSPEMILETWFGELTDEGMPKDEKRVARWFNSTPEFDQQLRWLFERDLLNLKEQIYSPWQDSAENWLAYVILLDQIPRNIYRGTAKAYLFDRFALKACRQGIKKKLDAQLPFCQRAFFYMPLMHSESEADQARCLKKFTELLETASPGNQKQAETFLHHARAHERIIAQFGRFPHRNTVLGRKSSPKESWFLETTSSSFGQNKN
jgi:uncharacterized protein (DUF924 family)